MLDRLFVEELGAAAGAAASKKAPLSGARKQYLG
jgi:hypothetical protein